MFKLGSPERTPSKGREEVSCGGMSKRRRRTPKRENCAMISWSRAEENRGGGGVYKEKGKKLNQSRVWLLHILPMVSWLLRLLLVENLVDTRSTSISIWWRSFKLCNRFSFQRKLHGFKSITRGVGVGGSWIYLDRVNACCNVNKWNVPGKRSFSTVVRPFVNVQ